MASNKLYYRPIPQCEPTRSQAALDLAAGWCWFDEVEVLQRGKAPRRMPALDVPKDVLRGLVDGRTKFSGISMQEPSIMGILNVTPDSFSDGGQFSQADTALEQAQKMEREGAAILDIGGESTRPGAQYVQAHEEMERTRPIIAQLSQHLEIPISIDTRKSSVAQAALEAGASIINDVYAFTHDQRMADVAAQAQASVCLMHAQGDPENMQNNPHYEEALFDVYDFLEERILTAERAGIKRGNICIDPGIGFGKTLEHNLNILRRISLFHTLGCPILLGVSRKSLIGHITGQQEAQKRLPGSLSLVVEAIRQGVQIFRVHDVSDTKQAIDVAMALK